MLRAKDNGKSKIFYRFSLLKKQLLCNLIFYISILIYRHCRPVWDGGIAKTGKLKDILLLRFWSIFPLFQK